MKVVVASGKGGTGKTTVAANLAYTLARTRELVAVDCDVDGPNLHLFFPSSACTIPVRVPVPAVDQARCTLCGECGRFCRFGALSVLPTGVLLMPELCHSCMGCQVVCPEEAIQAEFRTIGSIRCAQPSPLLTLLGGALNEGEVQAPAVIKQVKYLAEGADLIFYDAPPGIGCNVIETVKGADRCLLVTESTPFGAHDLALAAEMVAEQAIPAGVVINRSDGEDAELRETCRELGLPVLMTIPFDREIATIQNRGGLLAHDHPAWQERFGALFDDIVAMGVGP